MAVSGSFIPTEILLTANEEFLSFDVEGEYVEIDGSADYTTVDGPDGASVAVSTVNNAGVVGTVDEYVAIGEGAEITATVGGTIDVIEGESTVDVTTIGETTNISNVFNGMGGTFVPVSATVTTPELFVTYLADSTGGSFNIPLPAGASDGDWLAVWDAGDAFDDNPVTVTLNGYTTFAGIASDLVLNCSTRGVIIVYEAGDWLVFKDGRLGDFENIRQEIVYQPVVQNVYFSETQPVVDPPFVWYVLDGAGNLSDWKVVLP